jgi:hypothetical protein
VNSLKFNQFGNYNYLVYVSAFSSDSSKTLTDLNPKVSFVANIGGKTDVFDLYMPTADTDSGTLNYWVIGCFNGMTGL